MWKWAVRSLGGRASHILGSGTLRSLADVELDAVTFTQILEPFPKHCTSVKEVFLPRIVLDESEPFVHS
jgi:hypothetical protein